MYYDLNGKALGAFGSSVPDSFMRQVLSYSSNPIYELELVPVLLAMRVWGEVFKSGQIVGYVDNEAAKAALIRSNAATEDKLQLRCWYSRVPSKSNPADAPRKPPAQRCVLLGRGSLCT